MRLLLLAIAALVVCVTTAPARADWDLGDPAKWIQMPNMTGLDVKATGGFVADDFQCTEPGTITDIHFWGSWKGGLKGTITNVRVEFWTDDQSGDFSKPGGPRWGADFGPSIITERFWGEDDQGWYDPLTGDFTLQDHREVYQYNIDMSNLPLLFEQTGTPENPVTYWLLLKVTIAEDAPYDFGWKTALGQQLDDAVYDSTPAVWPPTWQELTDPQYATTVVSLDLAFVINAVPEPGLLAIAGLGLIALVRRRK
jgi:hypothetical protein